MKEIEITGILIHTTHRKIIANLHRIKGFWCYFLLNESGKNIGIQGFQMHLARCK